MIGNSRATALLAEDMKSLFLALAVTGSVLAQPVSKAHCQVELLCDSAQAQPGDIVTLGVRIVPEAGWHTYWKNPGESGLATEVKWDLPPGGVAESLQWPVPKSFVAGGILSFGYGDEHILIQPWRVPRNSQGPWEIGAAVSWLGCNEDQCLPGDATFKLVLNSGPQQPSPWHQAIHAQALPKPVKLPVQRVKDQLRVQLPHPGRAQFFPSQPFQIRETSPQLQEGGQLHLTSAGESPRLQGVLVVDGKPYELDCVIEKP